MPYSTTVDVISLEGGNFPPATGRIWMLWSVVGSGSGTGPQQLEQGSDSVQPTASSFPLSFVNGPDNAYSSRQIGLTIQDTNRVADDTGWWFRSGNLEVLPSQNIEIVLANVVDFTQADLDSSLPPMPMAVDASTTITSVTAMLQSDGFIGLVANGNTTSAGPSVTFTYTLAFKIVPSAAISDAANEVFDIETAAGDRGSIVFAGGVNAAILNAVNFFVLREIFPRFRNRLKAGINSAVISQIAGRIAPGTTTMPAGVVVSARSVHTNASRIAVRAALGAFGGVLSKFPPVSSGGGGGICGGVLLIGASTLASGLNLDVFRLFRDRVLASTPAGKRLIELYYEHSAEAANIVLGDSRLLGRAVGLMMAMQIKLKRGKPLNERIVSGCSRLLSDVYRLASAEFRRDVPEAFALAEQEGFFGLPGERGFAFHRLSE